MRAMADPLCGPGIDAIPLHTGMCWRGTVPAFCMCHNKFLWSHRTYGAASILFQWLLRTSCNSGAYCCSLGLYFILLLFILIFILFFISFYSFPFRYAPQGHSRFLHPHVVSFSFLPLLFFVSSFHKFLVPFSYVWRCSQLSAWRCSLRFYLFLPCSS